MRRSLDAAGIGLMVVVCASLGSQQAAIKAVAPYVTPMFQIVIRSAVAAALLAIYLAWRRGGPTLRDRHWGPGILAGVLFAVEFLFIAWGLTLTSASRMVVFLYTAPVFAALGLHWLLPEERLSRGKWLGVILAFAGVAVAFFAGGDKASLAGDAMGVAGGLCFGATTVVIRCSSLSDAPASKTLLYQLATAFVLLLAVSFVAGEVRIAPMPALAWASLAFQAVGVSLLTYLGWFWLLTQYPAAKLSVLSFLTPLFGVAFGMLLLNEPLEARFVAGAVLVVAGVLIVTRPDSTSGAASAA